MTSTSSPPTRNTQSDPHKLPVEISDWIGKLPDHGVAPLAVIR